jgi:hypothetical protein
MFDQEKRNLFFSLSFVRIPDNSIVALTIEWSILKASVNFDK